MSERFGLIGEKLGHSFSPTIHSMLGDYEYKLYEIEHNELKRFMETTELKGFNVTIPYKLEVIPYCSSLSDRAKAIGSVNTVVRMPDGSFMGDNTDYYGFDYLLSKTGCSLAGKKALVLGSGGASKTVCAVLKDRQVNTTVISRKGRDNYENISKHYDADIIVNTTPLGMFPNNGVSAVNIRDFPSCSLVLDLIYNPDKTELILQAEANGVPAYGGLHMLVAQAKMAAELFLKKDIPDTEIERIYDAISKQMKNIVIIGMPGCGKTTIGKALANKTGRKFIDLDSIISANAGRSIPEIFSSEGEQAFRRLETAALAEVSKQSGAVISAGGGTVTTPENRSLIRQNSIALFLERDINLLPTFGRPVSLKKGVEQIYSERYPLYLQWADITVKNDCAPEIVVNKILKELKL
jgi:shikimate dehydrogenase